LPKSITGRTKCPGGLHVARVFGTPGLYQQHIQHPKRSTRYSMMLSAFHFLMVLVLPRHLQRLGKINKRERPR